MIRSLRVCALAVLSLVGAPVVAADDLPLRGFDARYEATWNGLNLGEIRIRLSRESEFCYLYRMDTRPSRMVRMFYGAPSETSRFCIVEGQVRPVHFRFDGGKDSYALDFDWVKGEVRGVGAPRPLPANAQDRFGMQQAVRLWLLRHGPTPPEEGFSFTMVEDDRMREYHLAVTRREDVSVPHGEYPALLLERQDSDRINRFWVSPATGYMPVMVETGRDGKVQLRMRLKQFEREPENASLSGGEAFGA